MDWLTRIDPNVVIPVALSGLAWLYHKIRGDKKQAQRSLFDDIIENLIYELLDRYPLNVDVNTYLKASRLYLEGKIWEIAAKRGLPKNKTTIALMNAAMERGTALLAKEVAALRSKRGTS